MGFTDYHAHILESGSDTTTGNSKGRMIRYNSSYYPMDVGVEMTVTDLEQFRHMAEMQEPRLAVELIKLCITWDCGLASKSSENGRRMTEFRNSETMDRINAKIKSDDMGLEQMNYTEQKKR